MDEPTKDVSNKLDMRKLEEITEQLLDYTSEQEIIRSLRDFELKAAERHHIAHARTRRGAGLLH